MCDGFKQRRGDDALGGIVPGQTDDDGQSN
jgi:hypothetical protein